MTTHYVHAIQNPFPRIAVNTVKSAESVYAFEHPGATREELLKYVADHVRLRVEPHEYPATDDGAAEAFGCLEAKGGNLVGVADALPAPADILTLLGRAAFFFNRGLPARDFDALLNRGRMWLPEGAQLLRAAFVLMGQHDKDEPARFAPVAAGAHRQARVVYPAIMLAAMSVECALKAVIAETNGVSRDGELGFDGKPHDLRALAKSAAIEPADDDEADAIRWGRDFILWKGRFPSPRNAKECPGGSEVDEWPLLHAYRRLFFRAVESVAFAEHAKGGDWARDVSREALAAALVRCVSDWLGGRDSAPPAAPHP